MEDGGEVEGALLLAVAVAVAVWFGPFGWWARVRFGGLTIADLLLGEWQGQGTDYRAGGAAVRCGGRVEGWEWWEWWEWWRGSWCWPSRSILGVGGVFA